MLFQNVEAAPVRGEPALETLAVGLPFRADSDAEPR